MRRLIILTLFLISVSVFAQDAPTPPPINAKNLQHLQSVAQLDFKDMNAEFNSGWFAMNATGDMYALSDATGRIFIMQYDNKKTVSSRLFEEGDTYHGLMVDAYFSGNLLYPLQILDSDIYLAQKKLDVSASPQSLWGNDGRLFIETLPTENKNAQISIFDSTTFQLIDTLPYAPAQDPEAIVRIGRIHPPYTVTSSIDGIVKLWNLETGELLHEVDNGTGQAAVFGNINADATHLVWRDHDSQSLYLLNFETGENRYIGDLGGAYVQWFFLSNDASLIIAVNYNFEPNIIVWDTATGKRTDLGAYRQCNRPQPDMARLSADGTTLVIGCDTGLDIWRVVEE